MAVGKGPLQGGGIKKYVSIFGLRRMAGVPPLVALTI
jgi:hypothetical protein